MQSKQEQSPTPSLLNRLEAYVPGIEATINHLPQSILSLAQFKSWSEAFLVGASYVVASAVITLFLSFLLDLIATLAIVVTMATLISSIVLKLSQPTAEGNLQSQMLFDIGVKALAVALFISYLPAFINFAVVGLSLYRTKDLIINLIPENLITNIHTASSEAIEGAKTRFTQFSQWFAAEKNQAVREPREEDAAAATSSI